MGVIASAALSAIPSPAVSTNRANSSRVSELLGRSFVCHPLPSSTIMISIYLLSDKLPELRPVLPPSRENLG